MDHNVVETTQQLLEKVWSEFHSLNQIVLQGENDNVKHWMNVNCKKGKGLVFKNHIPLRNLLPIIYHFAWQTVCMNKFIFHS